MGLSAGSMEDEEANIGALGEDEENIDNNDQRISIEDENAVAGEEVLAAEEGNIRVPTSAIPQRHSATITNQSSWTIVGEAGVNWEAQLRRHQQKQVSYQDVRKVLENISLDELEQLNQKGRSALHFAARYSLVQLTRYLVEVKKMSIESEGEDGMMPIHYVCRYARDDLANQEGEDAETSASYLTLKVLLDNKADDTKVDNFRLTPLHHLAMRGNLTMVNLLLDRQRLIPIWKPNEGSSGSIDATDIQKSTPLHLAATYGHLDIFKVLLKNGASMLCLDDKDQNVLHRASQEGHWPIVEEIMSSVKNGEERERLIEAKDSDGNYPGLLATMSGGARGLQIFFGWGEGLKCNMDIPNEQGESPLHSASRAGDKELVKMLLEHGAKINRENSEGETALYLAAENHKALNPKVALLKSKETLGEESQEDAEDISLLRLLVDQGANLDAKDSKGLTPIMIAAVRGHTEVVKFLKEKGANLSECDLKDQNIIHILAKHNRHKMVPILMEGRNGAWVERLINQPNQKENTPLHIAAGKGSVETVEELLKEDYVADIDIQNWDKRTPCHLAAAAGHTRVLQLLLEHDHNAIFDRDDEDNTLLHLAAMNKHSETVKLLIAAGAPVQKRNRKEWTPLDSAAMSGCPKSCKLLLDNNSPLEPRDRNNQTPLHMAAMHGHCSVVQLLLDRGACMKKENREGYNALELAIANGHKQVVEVLLDGRHWKTAMKTVHTVENERPDTPMRMLIRKFPDLAERVLDKCITSREILKARGKDDVQSKKKQESYEEYEFDFQFLDDTFVFEKELNAKTEEVTFKYGSPSDLKQKGSLRYSSTDTSVILENHPLILMVKEEAKTLLNHPLSLVLLRKKWKMFGRRIFFLQFLQYVLFLASITGYTLSRLTYDQFKEFNTANIVSNALGGRGLHPTCRIGMGSGYELTLFTNSTPECVVFRIFSFCAIGLGLLIEVSQIIRSKARYFNFRNLIDWVLYLLSLLFLLDIGVTQSVDEKARFSQWETLGCSGGTCWQWPLGSFIITAAWLNFLFQLRLFGYFGFGFHILFINQLAFDSPYEAVLKTFVMMIGEYDFEGIFTEHHDRKRNKTENAWEARNNPFPVYSGLVFILFVIIMNMLVGLAVDDIVEIQNNAQFSKLSLNTRLVLESERFLQPLKRVLSTAFLKEYTKDCLILPRNESKGWLEDVLSANQVWERIDQREKERKDPRTTELEKILQRQDELAEQVQKLGEQLSEQGKTLRTRRSREKQEQMEAQSIHGNEN